MKTAVLMLIMAIGLYAWFTLDTQKYASENMPPCLYIGKGFLFTSRCGK